MALIERELTEAGRYPTTKCRRIIAVDKGKDCEGGICGNYSILLRHLEYAGNRQAFDSDQRRT